ncbi:MAG TPA: hypothetical protein VKF59_16455 [Candidatus Dormibacteraeota bacterium]|nr:hypothetical protein [Candidatus Dormibacteraeota bacterium]
MSRRRLRDDLHDAFEDLSEPAHPSLAGRVRDSIAHTPPPASRVPSLAVVVAVLVSLTVVAGLLVAGHRGVVPAGTPASQAPPTPGRVATPAPSTAATAPAPVPTEAPVATLPGFSCASQAGGGAGSAGLTGVRAGQQSGYDRFVIQFDGPVPRYQVSPQSSPTFTTDPRGSAVTLTGTAGLRVTVSGVANWTALDGPTDLQTGGPALSEARQVGAFEGVVTWGLGLAHAGCFRAYTLTGPYRLVVDVQD